MNAARILILLFKLDSRLLDENNHRGQGLVLCYIGSVLLSKSGLFHNQARRVRKSIHVCQHCSENQRKEKNISFRGASSLHDFAKIMLLCLQSWILNSPATFEWKSNKCFSTYTTSYAFAARSFSVIAGRVGFLAQTRRRKMAVKIQCKKRDDRVLFRASMCCSFLLHYTVIIVA